MHNIYYNNELYHHGILGMRWGHRKEKNNVRIDKRTKVINKRYVHDPVTNKNYRIRTKTMKKSGQTYLSHHTLSRLAWKNRGFNLMSRYAKLRRQKQKEYKEKGYGVFKRRQDAKLDVQHDQFTKDLKRIYGNALLKDVPDSKKRAKMVNEIGRRYGDWLIRRSARRQGFLLAKSNIPF